MNSEHDKKVLASAGKELSRIHDKIYPGQSYFLEVREEPSRNPHVIATTYGATAKGPSGKPIKGFSVSLRPKFFSMPKRQQEKVLKHEAEQHMKKPGQAARHIKRGPEHSITIGAAQADSDISRIAHPGHNRSKYLEDIHL